ncbi:hypothetical protein AAMO2058_000517700, partial [Amorphochlora amoebiformis]
IDQPSSSKRPRVSDDAVEVKNNLPSSGANQPNLIQGYDRQYCCYLMDVARNEGTLPRMDSKTFEFNHNTIFSDPAINSVPEKTVNRYINRLQDKIADMKKQHANLIGQLFKAEHALNVTKTAKDDGWIPKGLKIGLKLSLPARCAEKQAELEKSISTYNTKTILHGVYEARLYCFLEIKKEIVEFKSTCLQKFMPRLPKTHDLKIKAVLRALFIILHAAFEDQEIDASMKAAKKKEQAQERQAKLQEAKEMVLDHDSPALKKIISDEVDQKVLAALKKHLPEKFKTSSTKKPVARAQGAAKPGATQRKQPRAQNRKNSQNKNKNKSKKRNNKKKSPKTNQGKGKSPKSHQR